MKKVLQAITLLLSFFMNARVFGMEEERSSIVKDALRFMTYNIRRKGQEATPERLWDNRRMLVCSLLKKIQPDIVGLQEPTDEQIEDVREYLPNFSTFGESRGTSWWGLGDNEYNPIFYDTNKFTLLEHDTFLINAINSWFGWMPWHARLTGWLPRICTWGKFKVNETNQEFYMYNMHFDHMYEEAQIHCAKAVMRHVTEYTNNVPVVIVGDFNTEFAGEVKKIFANFQHAKEVSRRCVGSHETSTGWDSKKPQWIDHIAISKKAAIDVLEYNVVEQEGAVYPSDHRPVFADIILQK